uniref:Secreted protein n=1 Tax=Trypanosoma vivax (strain Y486) TaxID=1055687 RepID=G0U1X6_TRYVY|nr:conserved hypothetical protein [Trypanosoma vivax Y486]
MWLWGALLSWQRHTSGRNLLPCCLQTRFWPIVCVCTLWRVLRNRKSYARLRICSRCFVATVRALQMWTKLSNYSIPSRFD